MYALNLEVEDVRAEHIELSNKVGDLKNLFYFLHTVYVKSVVKKKGDQEA